MKAFVLHGFGIDHLKLNDLPEPRCGNGEVVVQIKALSLNYRDLLVIRGQYNPKLKFPAIPISDASGVIIEVGGDVHRLRAGDRVVTHFIPGWVDGPFLAHHPQTSLGTPGPGMAAERVMLPEQALLHVPNSMSFEQAATLPIAALTAWSSLVTVGKIQPGQTALMLGTGGVSIFGVQLAKSLGAQTVITSSSDEKLQRARALGADFGINYRTTPDWDKGVIEFTGGLGADVTLETGGAGTLERSMRAARAGGTIAFLGALTGLKAEVNLSWLLMKRLHIAGIYVDSRSAFEALLSHMQRHIIIPVIDRVHPFTELIEALTTLERGSHFGKIVLTLAD